MVTTSKGHIYKIICKVDEKFCYIGSTFNRLSKRMEAHRGNYNEWVKGRDKKCCACFSYFQKYGFENFKIILIKSYEVCRTHNKDTKHLRAYETLWINKTKCVNKVLPINYLRLEQKKEYYYKNRDELLVKAQEYWQKNKEKNRDSRCFQKREYWHNNKDKINSKRKEKVECEFCGNMISKSHLLRHQKEAIYCLKAQGK